MEGFMKEIKVNLYEDNASVKYETVWQFDRWELK